MKRVLMFSGGVGSWATGKRIVERHGVGDLTLLFADTKMEDEDLYRFLDEAAANIFGDKPPNIIRIIEGRTPWDVFFDERFLGNSRFDPCSKILKRQMVDHWLRDNCDPSDTTVYVGIDWTEEHRFIALRDRRLTNGWCYEAPMCEAPYLTKPDMLRACRAEGITVPRLYLWGFAHNNCGGFCIKAGIAHFILLLRVLPLRYGYHENKEQEIRAYLGRDISILTDRSGDGVKKPLTLRDLRLRVEAGEQFDMFDIGGCGCFVDETT